MASSNGHDRLTVNPGLATSATLRARRREGLVPIDFGVIEPPRVRSRLASVFRSSTIACSSTFVEEGGDLSVTLTSDYRVAADGRGGTTTSHRGPSARPSFRSSVTRGQSRASARATYQAS